MMGPLVTIMMGPMMACVNLWNHQASFVEMVLIACMGALSFSWLCMMAPMPMKSMKKAKAKAEPKKVKAAPKKAGEKRKKAEEEEVKESDEEFDLEAMTAADKKKIMSNLAGHLTNANAKLEKHVSGAAPLSDEKLAALKAKIEHCEKYSKLGQGDPEKMKMLLEFKEKCKGNLWGTFTTGFHKAEVNSESKKKGYGTKFLLLLLITCLFWVLCLGV